MRTPNKFFVLFVFVKHVEPNETMKEPPHKWPKQQAQSDHQPAEHVQHEEANKDKVAERNHLVKSFPIFVMFT